MKWLGRALALLAISAGTALWVPVSSASADSQLPFVIHMSSTGSDAGYGTRQATAIRSLRRAQEILRSLQPDRDVEIRIAPGTYPSAPLVWTYFQSGHTISLMPADYEPGDPVSGIAGRPVFQGGGAGFWFDARLPSGHPGGTIGMRFYYLRVEGYSYGGIRFHGGTEEKLGLLRPRGQGLNGNTVYGMDFRDMGSMHAGTHGYGGIDLVNSSANTIRNNHFSRLENDGGGQGLIHGVYLAHHSKQNVIAHNRFTDVTGAPLRTRNDSNDNDFYDNTFSRTGSTAQLQDWFCDSGCAAQNDKPRECASHGNRFHDNDNVSGYPRVPTIPNAVDDYGLATGNQYTAGGSPCYNNRQLRIISWGNR
ncbi:right-handed parallel beta-helix repeat-containing protein [Streptomyces sp. Lzd4kr]|nr:right-handed parallel beta-helix repeat-containing protein [Streptomyces sp. Lzd4kr]